MSKEPKPEDPEQLKRFKETARALGCDEDEAVFDEKLKAIARQQPRPKDEAAKRAGGTPKDD